MKTTGEEFIDEEVLYFFCYQSAKTSSARAEQTI